MKKVLVVIALTLLVALGVIGFRAGWFRKAVREASDVASATGPTVTEVARVAPTPPPVSPTPIPEVAIETPEGTFTAILTTGLNERNEPLPAAVEFPDISEKIYLVVTGPASWQTKYPRADTTWVAVKVEGSESPTVMARSILDRRSDGYRTKWLSEAPPGFAQWLEAPKQGFAVGDYRADVEIHKVKQSLTFKIVPMMPPATMVVGTEPTTSLNIALAALGGKVESATSEADDNISAARNLIDGFPMIISDLKHCRPSCGWWTPEHIKLPQEVVFSFWQGRVASIRAVVIDTRSVPGSREGVRAKHVEVWASAGGTDGFTKVSGATLRQQTGEYMVTFDPVQAKYVKLRFLSNYGDRWLHAGEVKILEAVGPESSIVRDVPKNLALPALGGAIVRFSSRKQHTMTGSLVDGSTDSANWMSDGSALPQDVLFGFRGDRIALVDRIVLNPTPQDHWSTKDPSYWPQRVSVLVSTETPFDGFEEVGEFSLLQEPRDQIIPIGRKARFLKLRIIDNFGGDRTTLGEVQIIEGSAPGYQSILVDAPAAAQALQTTSSATREDADVLSEKESNDVPSVANALELGRLIKGGIQPLGELDHFRIPVPGDRSSVLTVELRGRPNIRTSLDLLDAAGKPLRHFDPSGAPTQRAEFSWSVEPGDQLLRVSEPPMSLVLIWDTSGSMDKESVAKLESAVLSYLAAIRSDERLNLIRFSDQVEVLLPEFSSDPNRLKSAAHGKFFAEGGTPLYDAIAEGIKLLKGRQGNRAIVVMTDGNDSTSKLEYPEFWSLLEQERIRLYTIGLGPDLPVPDPTIGTSGNRFLAHIALATGGRFFLSPTAEELGKAYEQIAAELRALSTYYLKATVSRGPGSLTVMATGERMASVAAPPQLELIFDASGSMKAKLEGRAMIDIAKEAVRTTLADLPDDMKVALRVYGHRVREARPHGNDCKDTELMVPFSKLDRARLLERVNSIRALGTTPIAYSLQQVAGDFGDAPGEKLVILITDGQEECGGSPSAAVSDLLAKGLKVRLDIIGFALAKPAVKKEMETVAALTGGRFFDARDSKGLREAIEQALALPFEVQDATGTKIASGVTGPAGVELPEGVYRLVISSAGEPIVIPNLRIEQKQSTRVELKKQGKEIATIVHGP